MSADFTPEKEDYRVLSPFKMQVLTNFPYIEADFDALTNYQLLCKVVEYLNNVIANENEVTEQVTSLYNAYVSLQAYVNQEIGDFETSVTNRVDGLESYMNNYFNNLNVQEEINNKLDAMAADGTLTNLIKNYVDPIYEEYETNINTQVSSMSNAIDSMESKVDAATSGSPKGVYSTVSDLTTADPSHDYIYLVIEDGKWYYYDTTETDWIAGGTYQATEIEDNSIAYNKTKFLILGNQLFNKATITSGKYINYLNGNLATDAGSVASDWIIVAGLTHVINNYNNQCAFYDEDYTFISGFNDYESDVPATAYYMRVTVPNSTKAINSYMLNAGDTLLPYEDYMYKLTYLVIDKSKINFNTKIEKVETDFIVESDNLVDFNDMIDGKFIIYTTGYEGSNANFMATKYIRIDPSKENITLSPYNDNIGYQGAFYNKNKEYISGIYQNATTAIPASAYYVRISFPVSYLDKINMYYGNTTGREYEPYNNYLYKTSGKVFYVGANRAITTLKEGIEKATKYWESTVYVDEGVYDLVSEFGSSYLDNTSTEKGLLLKNRVHIIFDSNSFVTFNYTGNNEYVHKNFSPFNAGLYGFTIENLNLTASNCRYCVHDERGGSTDAYINKYINCKMSLDNSQNPDWSNPQNIGAGLGEKGYIIVDGCHFNNWCTWHNNNNTGYTNSTSKVVIKNNYFDNGFIYATDDYMTAFTNPSLFYVYNNCKKGNIVVTEGNTNIVVKEWNNIQHD